MTQGVIEGIIVAGTICFIVLVSAIVNISRHRHHCHACETARAEAIRNQQKDKMGPVPFD